jgi:hypothetical protein
MRISTMKWQAVTVITTSPSGLAREEAAALIAALDGIAIALRNEPAPEAINSTRERLELMAQLRDHAPKRRAAGRS